MLLDILKTFPNHPLTFSIDDKMGVEISSDYGKYKLSGYSGTEFPKSPVIEAPSTVTISSHIFQRAIEKTIFASGNADKINPIYSKFRGLLSVIIFSETFNIESTSR